MAEVKDSKAVDEVKIEEINEDEDSPPELEDEIEAEATKEINEAIAEAQGFYFLKSLYLYSTLLYSTTLYSLFFILYILIVLIHLEPLSFFENLIGIFLE